MPKNTKGGKGHKRQKNSSLRDLKQTVYADDTQYYGFVEKYHGSGRCDLVYIKKESGTEIQSKSMGILRGSIRKRCKLRAGDLVLLSDREFQQDRVDILLKYDYEDILELKRSKVLHPHILKLYDTNMETVSSQLKRDKSNNEHSYGNDILSNSNNDDDMLIEFNNSDGDSDDDMDYM